MDAREDHPSRYAVTMNIAKTQTRKTGAIMIFKTPWSYSVLSMFEQCRKKFYHLKIAKDAKDSDSSFAGEGKDVHDAMFKRVIKGVPLPLPIRHYEKWAAAFEKRQGEKHGEMKLCLNNKFEPVDWFAKDAWVRAIVDLLIIDGDTATIVDWKTGKIRLDWTQLMITAAVLSRLMPEINKFKMVFVWLREGKMNVETLNKEDMKRVWSDILPRVKAIEEAKKTTSFPANESGLCRYCPVSQCPHYVERDE